MKPSHHDVSLCQSTTQSYMITFQLECQWDGTGTVPLAVLVTASVTVTVTVSECHSGSESG